MLFIVKNQYNKIRKYIEANGNWVYEFISVTVLKNTPTQKILVTLLVSGFFLKQLKACLFFLGVIYQQLSHPAARDMILTHLFFLFTIYCLKYLAVFLNRFSF